jgi:hypothetical protein
MRRARAWGRSCPFWLWLRGALFRLFQRPCAVWRGRWVSGREGGERGGREVGWWGGSVGVGVGGMR